MGALARLSLRASGMFRNGEYGRAERKPSEQVVLGPKPRLQRCTDGSSWYARHVGTPQPKRLAESNSKFWHDERLKQVARLRHDESRLPDQRANLVRRVPFDVMVHLVMGRPEPLECRHRPDDSSTVLQNPASVPKKGPGGRHVLEHVEHQDQVKRSRWCIGVVELAANDAVAPRVVRSDAGDVRFDTCNVAESLERVEEQPCAAADIENSDRRLRNELFQGLDEHPLPYAPPPVIPVQGRIDRRVLRIHQSPPCTSATTYTGRALASPYTRPRYSPMMPRNSNCTPDRNVMTTRLAVNPIGTVPATRRS